MARRSFIRPSGFRDSRLIVIASEGSTTEPVYFEALRDYLSSYPSRVHVVVLRKEAGPSAPEHVVRQLDEFKKGWKLCADDELWAVIDYDKWGAAKLSAVAASATQKGYLLAVSRPCFEVWRLLHFEDLNLLSADERQALDNGGCSAVSARVRSACGSCGKNMGDIQEYLPLTHLALDRAFLLVGKTSERWPNSLGTTVHMLVKSMQGAKQ